MRSFHDNIEKLTLNNSYFRKVVYTGKHSQLVVMSLLQGEEIGMEVHKVDQFFRIEQGSARFTIDNVDITARNGDAVIVPAGSYHNVTNVGTEELKLYTIYSPSNHKDGTIHKTKADAIAAEKVEK